MRLHDLKPRPGAKHRRKRLGQGESSGHGKTSGRGGKGQTARSGSSIRIGFEGGQMPLIRRIPKRGFRNSMFRVAYDVVNLDRLAEFAGEKITPEFLHEKGVTADRFGRLKVLGRGDVTVVLYVSAHAFSGSAKEKIEKAGGKATVLEARAKA